MGKIIETKINRFDGGISDSVHELSANKFSISKHFDIFTDPYRLIPHWSLEADQTGQTAIGNFLWTTNSRLMGLGTSGGFPCVYYKTGATLITDNWATVANLTAAAGTVNYDCFVEHLDKIYFWDDGHLIQGTNDASIALSETYQTVSHTNVAQGLVHSANGTLYLPYDNKIAQITSAASFTADAAPSISADYIITSLAEYGTYLAIGCKSASGLFSSKVFLWDMVATTFVDIIDWGGGDLGVLNNLDGYLFGVSVSSTSTLYLTFNRRSLVIRQWGGGAKANVLSEIFPDPFTTVGTVSLYQRVNFIYNNRLYFSANIQKTTGGESRCGLFCIGKKSPFYNYAVTLDRVATNDNSENGILGAIIVGDACWTVYTAVGTINRTNDAETYSATSIYESQKFDGRIYGYDSSYTKKLIGCSVQTDSLPTAGQVVLKYRVDGASAWTTIFTNTTDSSISHDAINIESSGDNLSQYKEIEFRIENTGGGAITGFGFKEEIIDNKMY